MRLSPWASFLLAVSCSPGQDATLHTTVPLVVLPATVTDAKGHFTYGLGASDFLLLDNGNARAVRVDSPETGLAPLALVVLIQTSDTSQSALLKIQKAGAMVQQAVVGENAQGAIVTFSDEVTVVQGFTNSSEAIADAFHDLHPSATRKARMLDAIAKALEMLADRPAPSRSDIIIVGEAKDRGSESKLKDLLPRIERSAVTVDSLTYSAYLIPFTTKGGEYSPPPDGAGLLTAITETARLAKQNTTTALTAATGGRNLRFETQHKMENDLIHLGSEIHSRYLISFTPEQAEGGSFHSIELKVKNRPQLVVRTRPGYWSDLHQ